MIVQIAELLIRLLILKKTKKENNKCLEIWRFDAKLQLAIGQGPLKSFKVTLFLVKNDSKRFKKFQVTFLEM